MRDSIELEWAGVPAVVIVADALVGAAEAITRVSGVPDHPYVVTPFPVGNLTGDEVRGRATTIAPEVLRQLTEGRP